MREGLALIKVVLLVYSEDLVLVCLQVLKELCFPVCELLSSASIQAEVSEESHRFLSVKNDS